MPDRREEVESRRDQMTAGPAEPEYERMEQVAREKQQQEKQNPSWTQGETIAVQDVPEDERLQRPVGTETDSY
jgi:hypothetical protein